MKSAEGGDLCDRVTSVQFQIDFGFPDASFQQQFPEIFPRLFFDEFSEIIRSDPQSFRRVFQREIIGKMTVDQKFDVADVVIRRTLFSGSGSFLPQGDFQQDQVVQKRAGTVQGGDCLRTGPRCGKIRRR